MLNENICTTGEAAKIRGCSTENIRKLVRLGKLRVVAVVGNGLQLLDRLDVERLPRRRGSRVRPLKRAVTCRR